MVETCHPVFRLVFVKCQKKQLYLRLTAQARITALKEALVKRILVIDGAMGSMIQTYDLQEADYRGERFADYATDLKGNNDLLCLTKPEIAQEIHRAYLDGR